MKVPPCKDCEERYVGCHSKCVAYLEWKKEHDLYKNKIIEGNKLDYHLRAKRKRFP